MTKQRSTRREFLMEAGAGAATVALAGGAFGQENQVNRPNILFIVVDQLRMDCLGVYGNPDIKTPHIDKLASDGVRFDHSVCPFPVCTPSRYSLVSGLYVHDHRGWSNHCTLASDIATFPKTLRSAGYKTKAIGKMHMTPTYLDVGFEDLLLSEQNGPGRWDDDYHRYLMEKGLVDFNDLEDQEKEFRPDARKEYWDTFGALVSNLSEEDHSTTWVGDHAVESLGSWDAEGGNLLMTSFIKPHHPFDPPAPWHEMYGPSSLKILPGWIEKCFEHDLQYQRGYFHNDTLTEPALRRVMAYYYGAVSQIDRQVGRMIDSLKQRGLYDDTTIVFTADHGEYMGQHHLLLKGGLMYDSLLKVPLIVKWPGNPNAGKVSDRLANNIDLAPTFCSVAGLDPAESMYGTDLSIESGPELLFSESQMGNQIAARSRTRKLILVDDDRRKMKLKLFFDLEKDPSELKNLDEDPAYRAEAQEMEKALVEWGNRGSKKNYLNQDEKQIEAANVPPLDLSHRERIIRYFTEKMASA
jgi:arylsulfatase A-like enzyme